MQTYPLGVEIDYGFHDFIEDYKHQYSEPVLLGTYTCPVCGETSDNYDHKIWLIDDRRNTLLGAGEMFTSLDKHLAMNHLMKIWDSNFDMIVQHFNARRIPRAVTIPYRRNEIE
jgi:hypothetical protein